MVQERGNKDRA